MNNLSKLNDVLFDQLIRLTDDTVGVDDVASPTLARLIEEHITGITADYLSLLEVGNERAVKKDIRYRVVK